MRNTMDYEGYRASMVLDAADKIIVGRVLDIDDVIAFHGDTVSEFEANFHAAVDDYTAACTELGAKPEKPASGKLMLRIAPEVMPQPQSSCAKRSQKWAEKALGAAAH